MTSMLTGVQSSVSSCLRCNHANTLTERLYLGNTTPPNKRTL
jgi:hypothetical protein